MALSDTHQPEPEEHLAGPSRAKTFFREWDRIFGIVYGQDVRRAEQDASELGRLYGMSGDQSLKPLLFAVHTYYAALMKLLAAELASLQSGAFVASPLSGMGTATSRQLRAALEDMEDGGLFARLGIHNFLEGDFFGWYLDVWGDDIEVPLRQLARGLTDYEPATGTILPEATRDLLKKLYLNRTDSGGDNGAATATSRRLCQGMLRVRCA